MNDNDLANERRVELPWLDQKLAENSTHIAREDELHDRVIELEDRCLILERQITHTMELAEYWRERAGSTSSEYPFPWEEDTAGRVGDSKSETVKENTK